MKKTAITFTYDEERMNAIRLFLEQKGIVLEALVDGYLDTLYKKHVPKNVQEYLELKDVVTPEKPRKKANGSSNQAMAPKP